MKGNDRNPTVHRQQINGLLNGLIRSAQLVINLNPNSLKNLLGWMTFLLQLLSWLSRLDNFSQFCRCFNRLDTSNLLNLTSNLLRKLVFAVFKKDSY